MLFPAKSRNRSLMVAATVCIASSASSDAIEIEIDYSLDANGFFNQPGSKEAFRAVCDYFESILTDDLARIDQSEWTGETWAARVRNPATDVVESIPGKVIPADTVVIYAGGRPLGGSLGRGGPGGYSVTGTGADAQAWFNLVETRGESGALQVPPRDFASWGGSVAFNTSTTWNFSLTSATGNPSFVSTALHELGHIFGVGTSASWTAYIIGSVFTGPKSAASFGANVPMSGDGAHWRDDAACVLPNGYNPLNPLNVLSKTVGQFGTPAGLDQIARMDPSSCQIPGNHLVFTELDLAGLDDIGWDITSAPPAEIVAPALAISRNPSNGHVTLSWTAENSFAYQLEESPILSGWQDLGSPVSGVSGPASVTDTTPPTGANFYRLEVGPAPAPVTPPSFASAPEMWLGEAVHGSREPAVVENCGGCAAH
ncbi:hypothetical protein HZ994_05195 [Akkermansiaceae bacterium]|nr:hypothetical protein HZ994_05195 [Akkermansiaceae bacterium]